MNLRELYSDNLFQEAFDRLQKARARSSKYKNLITNIAGPEVISDDFLREWIAFNYLWLVDFRKDGGVVMGEIGGVIPTNPENQEQILAVSSPGIEKILYGFGCLRKYERTGDRNFISMLEKGTEMPLEKRNGITVINGNRNYMHYDFTTIVSPGRELDSLKTNIYILLGAEGMTVLTNKALPQEQFIFNIPQNKRIFDRLRKIGCDDKDKQLVILNEEKEQILPKDFIYGFHVVYEGSLVRLRAVVSERDLKGQTDFLKENGLEAVKSTINDLGTSGSYGAHGPIYKISGRMIK